MSGRQPSIRCGLTLEALAALLPLKESAASEQHSRRFDGNYPIVKFLRSCVGLEPLAASYAKLREIESVHGNISMTYI